MSCRTRCIRPRTRSRLRVAIQERRSKLVGIIGLLVVLILVILLLRLI